MTMRHFIGGTVCGAAWGILATLFDAPTWAALIAYQVGFLGFVVPWER